MRLRELRVSRGLSTRKFAEQAGIDSRDLSRYEQGKCCPTRKTYNKLARVLGWKTVREPKPIENELKEMRQRDEEQMRREIQERQKALQREFVIGKRYMISDNNKYADIFEYQGKQGIHHCFKANPGGWTRTYADNQLIGKKIKEVT